MSERIDLLVHGGEVLTVDDARTVVPGGAVAVHDGAIAAVGAAEQLRDRFAADTGGGFPR
jgi:5-methylthioadenosine/S-adenosylhomocysteine deaminase